MIRCLAGRLEDCGRRTAARLVIHGDFTSHNVIADGNPRTVTGIIDFHRAHLEVPLAGIACGLWRSGRPRQDADYLEPARLRQFVHGYASTASLPPGAARAIPACSYGRGRQMITKRVRAGQPETGMLAEAE